MSIFFTGKAFAQVDSLQSDTLGMVRDSSLYATRGAVVISGDTLFFLYDSFRGFTATERAKLANEHLTKALNNNAFRADSISYKKVEYDYQIRYRDDFLFNLTPQDLAWYDLLPQEAVEELTETLKQRCAKARSGINLKEIIKEVLQALLIVVVAYFVIRYVNKLFRFFSVKIYSWEGTLLKGIYIRTYELLNAKSLVKAVVLINRALRLLVLLLIFYITLPLILNIFPFTKGLAETLFNFILDPLRKIGVGLVDFFPDLISILLIILLFRYLAKGVRFLAKEVETGKLQINGFYPDWAQPTSRIIIIFLYAFMLIFIWPYIPGSDSDVFKGVSVFLGLLISLGSSSAISNTVAGLVITYMRPFKIGDRVKIGENVGDVIYKNLLVTRVKTVKNEIITVPNSNILNNSSINYSTSSSRSDGLIIHSTITIGYDVPWRKVHSMLIEAAKKTPHIETNPVPFVLQTSLDDFYVSYEINAFTHAPNKQALIYSDLHALIQDIFAKNGVEIMSPHYRAMREGPDTTPKMHE